MSRMISNEIRTTKWHYSDPVGRGGGGAFETKEDNTL